MGFEPIFDAFGAPIWPTKASQTDQKSMKNRCQYVIRFLMDVGSIFEGLVVDLVVISSTATPFEFSSRLGAVLIFAILGIWFCLASWMVKRAQHGSNLDHQTTPKSHQNR